MSGEPLLLDDLDESASAPVELIMPGTELGALHDFSVDLVPRAAPPNARYEACSTAHASCFSCASCRYRKDEQQSSAAEFLLKWRLDERAANQIAHLKLSWTVEGERDARSKTLDGSVRETRVPVHVSRSVFHFTLEPVLRQTETLGSLARALAVMAPGTPDAPRICLRSATQGGAGD